MIGLAGRLRGSGAKVMGDGGRSGCLCEGVVNVFAGMFMSKSR